MEIEHKHNDRPDKKSHLHWNWNFAMMVRTNQLSGQNSLAFKSANMTILSHVTKLNSVFNFIL